MAQVVLERLTKLFQGPAGQSIRAVDNASLTVQDKELLVLVGPSGCGKTTTLRLIAGLEEPTEGAISIGGKPVSHLPPKERDVAMVFQHFALYPHMTVYDNLAFGLKLRRFSRAETDQRVRDTARILHLDDCLDRLPAALSGGQRQRVALGRALVRRPSLLLLDEPLSNLDAATRLQMRAEITRLHARLGSTMLYVTHDQVEALTLGHRVAVMQDGRIQQVDAPTTLYAHPANLFVAGFIGSPPMNLFDGTLAEKGPALVFEETPRASTTAPRLLSLPLDASLAPRLRPHIGKPVVLGIRPEHITCSAPARAPSPQPAFEAVVELVQPMGAETYLHLAGHARPIIARVAPNHPAVPGQTLSLAFDLHHCHFFDSASGGALR
jgi:multiple sugar transport system ATP-binding protein